MNKVLFYSITPPGVSVISRSKRFQKPVGMAPRDITSGSVHHISLGGGHSHL